MTSRTLLIVGALVGMGSVLIIRQEHNEDALMGDWSAPPPLPIFILVNVLAGAFRSMADALTPPPVKMFDMAFAYHTTMLAHICQKFTIPDFLATGPKTVEEIAQHMKHKGDKEDVERLMYALVADGMTKLDKNSPDPNAPRFVNSALSAVLRSDHPNSCRGFVGHNADDAWNVWGSLPLAFGPDAVNAFDVAWPEYPLKEGGLWKLYEANDWREEQFGRAMMTIEGLGGKAMAADGPFHKFKRVIDVGGSMGHFVYKILDRYPNMQGVIFDRSRVIANSRKHWTKDGTYGDGTQERLEFVEGDFFQVDTFPEAKDGDAYHLRFILHDWEEEECLAILKNIKQKMGNASATLVIGECAMPDRHTVGVPAFMHHMDMQMMALFRAKERTPKMWKELLAKAGFEIVAIHPTRSLVHFVEAIPVSV